MRIVYILLAHAFPKIYQLRDISHESRSSKSGAIPGAWDMDGISCLQPHKPLQNSTLLCITIVVGSNLDFHHGYSLLMTSLTMQHQSKCWIMSHLIWVSSRPCDISRFNGRVRISIWPPFVFYSLFCPLPVASRSWRLELRGTVSRMNMERIYFHPTPDGHHWTNF